MKTEYLCIFNADGSFDPKYLNEMLELCKDRDYVFASRYLKGAGSDDDTIVTKIGTQTLENKTINGATFNSPTFNSLIATALNLTDSSIVFEGATADSNETTLTVVDPTADRTITIPNETGTLITSASAATNQFSVALAAALG